MNHLVLCTFVAPNLFPDASLVFIPRCGGSFVSALIAITNAMVAYQVPNCCHLLDPLMHKIISHRRHGCESHSGLKPFPSLFGGCSEIHGAGLAKTPTSASDFTQKLRATPPCFSPEY